MLTGVEISKDLHPQHCEDVDEDDEDEGEVGLTAQCGDDDGEEDPHSAPGLSQLEDPHHPHQPHSSHDRQTIAALQAEVEQADGNYEEIKDVPAALEIFPPLSGHLQDSLRQEEGGEGLQYKSSPSSPSPALSEVSHLVSHLQNLLEARADPVMLHRQEESVEDNTESDARLEHGAADQLRQKLLTQAGPVLVSLAVRGEPPVLLLPLHSTLTAGSLRELRDLLVAEGHHGQHEVHQVEGAEENDHNKESNMKRPSNGNNLQQQKIRNPFIQGRRYITM